MKNNINLIKVLSCLEDKTKIKMFLDASHQDEEVAIALLENMEITEDDNLRLLIQNAFFQEFDYDDKKSFQSKLKKYIEDLFVLDVINVLPSLTTIKEFSTLEYERGLNFLREENFKKLLTLELNSPLKKFWLNKLCQETNFDKLNLDDDTLQLLSHCFFDLDVYEQKKLLLNSDILSFLPKNFLQKMNPDQNKIIINASQLLINSLNTEKSNHNKLVIAIKAQLKPIQITKVIKELELDYYINMPNTSRLKTLREHFPFELLEVPFKQGIMNEIEIIVTKLGNIENTNEFLNYLVSSQSGCIFFEDIEDMIMKNLDILYYENILENYEVLTKLLYVSNYTQEEYNHLFILQKVHNLIEKNKESMSDYFYPRSTENHDEDEVIGSETDNRPLLIIEKISKSMEKYILENSLTSTTSK